MDRSNNIYRYKRPFWLIPFAKISILITVTFLCGFANVDKYILPLPEGAKKISAVLDHKGAIHIVYQDGNDAYYTVSYDGGKTVGKRILITSLKSVYASKLEIAVGRSGNVYITHWDKKFKFQRKPAGAKQFSDPVEDVGGKIAVDENENIFVTHLGNLDKRPATKTDPYPTNIWVNISYDKGKTFLERPVRVDKNGPGSACDCCTPDIMVDNEKVYVAYRNGAKNERNIYLVSFEKQNLLKGPHNVKRIGAENWVLNGCPASSPSITGGGGKVVVAWMTGETRHMPKDRINLEGIQWRGSTGGSTAIFYVVSTDGGKTFSTQRLVGKSNLKPQNYPMIGMAERFFLLGWKNGDRLNWVSLPFGENENEPVKEPNEEGLGIYEDILALTNPSLDTAYIIWSSEDRKTYSTLKIDGKK